MSTPEISLSNSAWLQAQEHTHQEQPLDRWQRLVPITLTSWLISWVLIQHPYAGLWHDARLYALQAYARLHPQLTQDLFLVHGSQDNFTLFSPLYAALIQLVGLDTAALALQLFGLGLFYAAAYYFASALTSGWTMWLFMSSLAALPVHYGASKILAVVEPFATPRLFAEGLSLVGLATLLKGRHALGGLMMLCAGVVHPIMAGCGAALALLWLAKPKATLILMAYGLLAVIMLAYAEIGPFRPMDSTWFTLAQQRSPFLMTDGWEAPDYNRIIYFSTLLVAAGLCASGAIKRLSIAALCVGVAGVLLTWLGGNVLHNALLIQLQPWRALWVTETVGLLAYAFLTTRWHAGQGEKLAVLGFASGWLLLDGSGGLIGVASLAYICWARRRGIVLSGKILRWLWLLPLLAVLWYGLNLYPSIQAARLIHEKSLIRSLLNDGVVSLLALIGIGWLLVNRPDRRTAVAGLLGGLALLTTSLVTWDERERENLWEGERYNALAGFRAAIPRDAVVYWPDKPTYTWFLLERANYMSSEQSAGLVFSRPTALEAKRRADRLASLGVRDGIFDKSRPASSALTTPSLGGLVWACADAELDFIVHGTNFGEGIVADQSFSGSKHKLYLYDCSKLRNGRFKELSDKAKT